MADIKDKYIANEIERIHLAKINERMQKIEGTSKGLESDINVKNIALLTALFVPAVYPILTQIVGGEVGGKLLKNIIKLIAPSHTTIQSSAELFGNIIGSFAGDPAAIELIAEKFGLKSIEDIKKLLPEIIETLPKTETVERLSKEQIQEKFANVIAHEKGLKHGTKILKELETHVMNLFKTKSKKEAMAKLEQFEKTYDATGDIVTAMYDAQLSNPRIGLTKLITDQLFLPIQIIARSLGVAGEYGITAGTKNAMAAFYAYKESFKEALKYAIITFNEDRPAFQEMLGLGRKQVFAIEKFSDSSIAKSWRWLWAVASSGRRFVMTADQFAKAIAWRANKHMASYMMALDEAEQQQLVGASLIHYADLRSEELINSGNEVIEARANLKMFEDTFTDQGKLIKSLSGVLNDIPILRIIVPYLRTPAALIKQGVYISPLAPLTSSFRNDVFKSAKPWKLVDQNTAIAKWAIGTAIYGIIADETAKGNIIGNGPETDLRDVWPNKKHPQSIKIGDNYYGYRHLGPFATILSMAADSAEMFHYAENDDFTQQQLLDTVGSMLANKSEDTIFLQSMANVIHAVDSLKQGGTEKAAMEFLGQEISGFIPTPVRITAHIEDPIIRKAQNTFDIIKENIPGWSKTIPPRRDRFGYLMYQPVGSGPDNSATKIERLLNNLSPVPIEGDTNLDDVDKELFKLGIKHRQIPDHIGDKDVQVKISPIQQSEWERLAGHEFTTQAGNGKNLNQHDFMQYVINQPYYTNLPLNLKKQYLETVSTFYRNAGKEELLRKNPLIHMEIIKSHEELLQSAKEQEEIK